MEKQSFIPPSSRPVALDRRKRVLALIDYNEGYNRGILRGLRAFAHSRPDWIFRQTLRSARLKKLLWWKPDGVIFYRPASAVLRAFRSRHLPLVSVMQRVGRLPLVGVDDKRVGAVVAEYFLNRGFREMGLVTVEGEQWSAQRQAGFQPLVEADGCRTHVYQIGHAAQRGGVPFERGLQIWLENLPKPAAVFAANDVWAREVVQLCNLAGIHVPEEIAVMGVDDDEFLCGMAEPEVSSVHNPWQQIGYEAGALLDQMMHDAKKVPREILIPPERIVTRQSSDIVAIADPYVAQALRFIKDHACEGLGVTQVLQAVPVGRRWLERRFTRELRRSPLEEIQRVRLMMAERLLAETDLPMSVIGPRCGIGETRFCSVFRQETGLTPTQWRRRCRPGGGPVIKRVSRRRDGEAQA